MLSGGERSLEEILSGYSGARTHAGEQLANWVATGRRIAVFGDFDVDGLTSVSIAAIALAVMRGMEWTEVGLEARIRSFGIVPMIPERSDGYGLRPGSVQAAIAAGAETMLVLDSGSGADAGLLAALDCGVPLVVVDHHAVQPAVAEIVGGKGGPLLSFINSHDGRFQGPGHPGDTCSGHMTLALMLETASRLVADLDNLSSRRVLETLAALAVVADMMELKDDKRVLVKAMLPAMDSGCGPGGLRALIAAERVRAKISNVMDDPAGRDAVGHVDVDTLGFSLAPRLNSLARSGMACEALSFLLSSFDRARMRLDGVDRVNKQRQAVQHDMTSQLLDVVVPFAGAGMTAGEILARYPDRESVRKAALIAENSSCYAEALVIPGLFAVGAADFSLGVAGLIAGSLALRTGIPILVTGRPAGTGCREFKGSGRVPERHPIAQGALDEAFGVVVAARASQIGGGGGGHNAAFGVSFRRQHLDDPEFVDFAVDVAMVVLKSLEGADPSLDVLQGSFDLDCRSVMEAQEVYSNLGALRPFGRGLKAPLLAIPASEAEVSERASSTLMVRLGSAGASLKAIGFASQLGSVDFLHRSGAIEAIENGRARLVGELQASFYGRDDKVRQGSWNGPPIEMKIADIVVED